MKAAISCVYKTMDTSDERGHTRGNTTGPVLRAVDEALHNALSDVRRTRELVEEYRARDDDNHAEALQRLLHTVEANLMDTVVGIRLASRHQEGASTSDATRPTQAYPPTDPFETSDTQQCTS